MEVDPKLIEFLLNPDNYPEKPHTITHYETHISHVFVGDSHAYKIKKPVDLGFLDFTSLEKRRLFCREEVRLNARLAADFYLGVSPVYSNTDDYSFTKETGSEIAEYTVKMRKVPEERLLHQLIVEGRLLYKELEPVGLRLARFHDEVPAHRSGHYGGLGSIIATTEENHDEIRPFVGLTIDQRLYDDLVEYTRGFIRQWKDLFAKRTKDGLVREGHGDLHSKHICLIQPPVIFDCIEFSKRFRISDILEDIAFLLMDLESRGRFDLSRALFKSYFSVQRDALVSQLLRFYKVYRAVVRAKIEGLTSRSLSDEGGQQGAIRRARNYYALADHYLKSEGAHFNPVVLMGVSGSGKSAIANGLLPDAVVFRSDVVRKELLGQKPDQHTYVEFGAEIYADDITGETYRLLAQRAVEKARSGKRVLVDATYLKEQQRLAFFGACCAAGLNPFFIDCFAPEPVLRKRVERRTMESTDVSDGHSAILEKQLAFKEEPTELPFFRVFRLNTDEDLETIQKALRELLL
jgi:aminoglycoside phosphotransferase family enzyme/predicted kinase